MSSANDGIIEKTARLQEDHIQVLKRDDGTTRNVYLIDKRNIHHKRLQVINQYEADGRRATRLDVTILVNGLPMVHVELKRRGVDIREAFNQINRFQRDRYWAGSGLFEYVQLFVISNGTLTKYYSNTVRDGHLAEQRNRRTRQKTSNSYAFTSWWADAKNRPITDLTGFTRTFFAKHALLNILTKYCVFDVDRKLLVMRPYQIARELSSIDKVLFVVDRKELDYQTIPEYERFGYGAANSNTSTAVLQRQLEDSDARIIITTIQKLSRLVARKCGYP